MWARELGEVAERRSRQCNGVGIDYRVWQLDRRFQRIVIDIVDDRDGAQYFNNNRDAAIVVCARSRCDRRARNALPNDVLGSDLRCCELGRLLHAGRGHP